MISSSPHDLFTRCYISCFNAQPYTNGHVQVHLCLLLVKAWLLVANHNLDSLKYCDDTMT